MNRPYKDLSKEEIKALVLDTMIDHTEIDTDTLLSSTTLSIETTGTEEKGID